MPVTFYKDLHLHYEALTVISALVNNTLPDKTYDKFVKAGRAAEADALMGDLFAVFEHVKSNYDVTNPRIIDFFKYWDENIYDEASLAHAMASMYMPNRIPEMLNDFKAKDEIEQKKLIAYALLPINEEQADTPTDFESVIKKIDSMPVSSDLKFRLVKIYNSYYENLCYLTGVLDDVSLLISEKLKPLQERATEVITELEKNSNKSMNYISKKVDMRLMFNSDIDIEVYPCSFIFGASLFGESVHDTGCLESGGMRIAWGTRFEQIKKIINEIEENSDQAIEALRVLIEKTKFEILSALRNGPMYGTELAQKLELTGATVSHHVSGLLRHNLISANPEQNKVYYSIDKQHINEILLTMEKFFEV